jgi:signal transduction histidine kinase
MDVLRDLRASPRRRSLLLVDGLLGGTLAAVQLALLVGVEAGAHGAEGYAGLGPVAVVLSLVTSLPVAVRRLHPDVTLALVGLGMVAAAAFSVPITGMGLVVALYSYAAHTTKDDGIVVLAVFGGFTVLSLVLAGGMRFLPLNVVVFATAWVLGDRQRQLRLRTTELERRAAALERERERDRQLARARERTRIAQELHDVVAHGVTAMVTQAGAAQRLIGPDPDRATTALHSAEEAGRVSLGELRRLLGLLRASRETAHHLPQPGIGQIRPLVEAFGDLSLDTRLELVGDPLDDVPPTVALVAYRVVQEGLTNVLLHARATRADVRLRLSGDLLEVRVHDDGVSPSEGKESTGLEALRRRVRALAGTMREGRDAGGGNALEVSLPLGGRP